MPNYVKNILKMKGLKDLPLFEVKDGKHVFDFNKIIPMPQSLNVLSGSITESSIVYFLTDRCTIPIECLSNEKKEILDKLVSNRFPSSWAGGVFRRVMREMYLQPSRRDSVYELGRIYVSNCEKYNSVTWYDWCINNWGTKWNAMNTEIIDSDSIKFETAWRSPNPIVEMLSKIYPEFVVELWYADEDMGCNTGYMRYFGGVLLECIEYGKMSNPAYENYIKCWGPSNCLYRDESGDWKIRDCESCGGCD